MAFMLEISQFVTILLLLLCVCSNTVAKARLPIAAMDFLRNMADTTVYVIINQSCIQSEKVLVDVIQGFENVPGVTFLIGGYSVVLATVRNKRSPKNNSSIYEKITKLPKLHGLERGIERNGFTHVYIIHSKKDLEKAVGLKIVYFSMIRANPKFILFWSTNHISSVNWKYQFQRQVFYLTMRAMRFLIARETDSDIRTVWLICNVCLLHGSNELRKSYLAPVDNVIAQNFDHFWLELHRNHHQLKVQFSQRSLLEVSVVRRQFGMSPALERAFNITFGSKSVLSKIFVGIINIQSSIGPHNIKKDVSDQWFSTMACST